MAKFGANLEELRKDYGLSQKELGNILHVTPGTISNYENNVNLPSTEKLIDLANYFHVSTDYLLGRCSFRSSPDVWNQCVVGNHTIGELIHAILGMSQDRKNALALVINDMSLSTTIVQYQQKEPL